MDALPSQAQEKITTAQNTFPHIQDSSIDRFFRWSIKNRERIISVFKLYYYLLFALILTGGYSAYRLDGNFLFFYDLALWSGKIGLIFYILTVLPGIARRFGIKHKAASILMIFRRYTGIAMFLHVFSHYVIIRGARTVREGLPASMPPIFEMFGLYALVLAGFLFLTSNDYAVTHLRKIWNRIHQLTYIIIWLIAFHIVLQRISVWSVLISIVVILQVASYLYSRLARPKQASPSARS